MSAVISLHYNLHGARREIGDHANELGRQDLKLKDLKIFNDQLLEERKTYAKVYHGIQDTVSATALAES